jgi:hypothetical protein
MDQAKIDAMNDANTAMITAQANADMAVTHAIEQTAADAEASVAKN